MSLASIMKSDGALDLEADGPRDPPFWLRIDSSLADCACRPRDVDRPSRCLLSSIAISSDAVLRFLELGLGVDDLRFDDVALVLPSGMAEAA